jgi:predicted dithiol-disulfide oxidoreductase (DUF899 family)
VVRDWLLSRGAFAFAGGLFVNVDHQEVLAHEECLEARKSLLDKEKEFTRLRDEPRRPRRELPWEAVSKEDIFEDASGPVTLSELSDGRCQLIVYQFMFGPDWDAGCLHCSFWADNFDGIDTHLHPRRHPCRGVARTT